MSFQSSIKEVDFIKSVAIDDCYVDSVEDADENIQWIQARDFGVRVATESGRIFCIPWGNIVGAEESL
jgi:hypothetical protein